MNCRMCDQLPARLLSASAVTWIRILLWVMNNGGVRRTECHSSCSK